MPKSLYPEIEPYRTGQLSVSPEHNIYFEESGNPYGASVLFVHGGPGSGSGPLWRRFYDPSIYRIILYDQRGCGKSTPYASLYENETSFLIKDMELLRKELGIETWMLVGGSWVALSHWLMHNRFQSVSKLWCFTGYS